MIILIFYLLNQNKHFNLMNQLIIILLLFKDYFRLLKFLIQVAFLIKYYIFLKVLPYQLFYNDLQYVNYLIKYLIYFMFHHILIYKMYKNY